MSSEIEYFDKVDSDNKVIGTTYKKEAHSKGYVHRAVAIFVFDNTGKLLVQVHEKGGGILDHTVGGHVRKDESFDEAATREMQEEINLDASVTKIGELYSDETYTGSQFRHMFAVYKATADKNWKFKPNDEVKKLLLMDIKEVVDLMAKSPRKFTAGFIHCMQFYCKQQNIEFKLDLNQYKKDRLSEE